MPTTMVRAGAPHGAVTSAVHLSTAPGTHYKLPGQEEGWGLCRRHNTSPKCVQDFLRGGRARHLASVFPRHLVRAFRAPGTGRALWGRASQVPAGLLCLLQS